MGLYIKSNDLFSNQDMSTPEGPVVIGVEVENEMNMGHVILVAKGSISPIRRFRVLILQKLTVLPIAVREALTGLPAITINSLN